MVSRQTLFARAMWVTEINKAEFENEKFRDHVLKTIPSEGSEL